MDLAVRRGEFLAVLGQNGSGKTTLVKHFNGLLEPTEGSVRVEGEETGEQGIRQLGQRVGYVFQNPDHQIFSDTVFDEVAFGPKIRGLEEDEVKERVEEALAAVGLEGYEEEDPFGLTKGERQRVAVASVLAVRPEVLILDEPTTGLDYAEQRTMMDLVRRLNEAGSTIIVVTHTMWVVAEYAHRAAVIADGKIVLYGTVREVFAEEEELRDAALGRRTSSLWATPWASRSSPWRRCSGWRRPNRRAGGVGGPFLYLDRDTFVHRLDPRTKMFLLVGTFVIAFLFVNPLYGLVVLALVLAFGALARSLVNLKRIWFILLMIARGHRGVVVRLRQRGDAAVLRSWSRRPCSTASGSPPDRHDDHCGHDLPLHHPQRGDHDRAGEAGDPLPVRLRRLHGAAGWCRPSWLRARPSARRNARAGSTWTPEASSSASANASPVDPGLRLHDTLDQRVLDGPGIQGVRGQP